MTAGRKINAQSQDWGTPPQYVEAVKKVFGGRIDLDPCSSEYSIVRATVEYRLPERDGLKESWNYPTIYVNPPYGLDRERGTSIKQWLARCAVSHQTHGAEVIALVPVATNTGHWKSCIFGKASAVCFLYDTRLKFVESGRSGGKGAPMACATVYWGSRYDRFFNVFVDYGAVIDVRPLIGVKIGDQRKNKQMQLIEGVAD
ncbi:MAG: DNA N-6-adenine-methyltransferase [Caldilineaceae bacterium]|nr:DNA N-6-adenine-methyltransferase [Caldilineaceae bacterium]